MKVVFLHPDLGIGGAERLVIDAAFAYRSYGHEVHIVTNHFTQDHSFSDVKELANDRLITTVRALPRSIFGKFHALCAYISILIAAFVVWQKHSDADIIFCDQISLPIVFLRKATKAKIVFYCHYPDQLLAPHDTFLRKVYRWFLDMAEYYTTGMADVLFANSKFTSNVIRATFPSFADKEITVLYPSLNTDIIDNYLEATKVEEEGKKMMIEDERDEEDEDVISGSYKHVFRSIQSFENVFLSINRFERKKNIELAIMAFADLSKNLSIYEYNKCVLVIAGGYDVNVRENIEYYYELENLVVKLDLVESVKFLQNPTELQKYRLYKKSTLVIYTPSGEHFGIVPLEAMYVGRPVLAVDNGGPTETIVDGTTGFLRKNDSAHFGAVMLMAVYEKETMEKIGKAAHKHVADLFPFKKFASRVVMFTEKNKALEDSAKVAE